jgi:hypothetical protein
MTRFPMLSHFFASVQTTDQYSGGHSIVRVATLLSCRNLVLSGCIDFCRFRWIPSRIDDTAAGMASRQSFS